MFGGGGSAAAEAALISQRMPQNSSVCSECKGYGYFNKYKSIKWFGSCNPKPIVERIDCKECRSSGYIRR